MLQAVCTTAEATCGKAASRRQSKHAAATATLTTGSGRKDRLDREPGLALDSASVFNTFEARAGVVDQTREACPKNTGLRWSRRER